jgi:hypothetical protein
MRQVWRSRQCGYDSKSGSSALSFVEGPLKE